MSKISKMQGVPAHLETLKSDGHRRHPSHCVFAEGKGRNRICLCTEGTMYNIPCRSAKQCDYYKEKEG